jgi:hypothetical protein
MHDMSKFSLAEFMPYCNYFFDEDGKTNSDKKCDFNDAWRHHYLNNMHHPEYYRNDKTLMRYFFNRHVATEMIADWFAACRVYEGHWPIDGEWDYPRKIVDESGFTGNIVAELAAILIGFGYTKTAASFYMLSKE